MQAIDDLNVQECVRCGHCMEHCPTFDESITESMGPRGRIMLLRQVQEHALLQTPQLEDRIYSCLLCGACSQSCPAGVNIVNAIYAGRILFRKQGRARDMKTAVLRYAYRHASVMFRLMRLLPAMMSLPYIRNIPAVQVMLRMRNTQSQIPLPLREGGALYRLQNARGRVAVFAGCTVDFLYPSYGRALIQSLLALRYDVVLPKGEVCCGAPLLSLGFRDDAVALAEKNVRLFRDLRVEAVISLCPTCVYYLRDVYRMLLGESVGSVMDDITFFANHQDRLMEKAHHLPVAYHASCHTRNMLKSDRAARTLLAAAGYESGSPQEGCCGFGETFSVLYDEMSASLRDKMLASYCNYNTIITSCPNCMLQFERGLNNTDKKIRHSIEIIHESLTGAKP